jgi:hypothetical protein
MCASAPAMKVFFKRYFSLSIASGSYSRSGTGRSRQLMSRSRDKGSFSTHSAMASRGDPSGLRNSVPLNSIKVSQGLEIHVEERDDMSQKSFASTKNLTALPSHTENDMDDWKHNTRTVWAGFRPSSRNGSRAQVGRKDVELGHISG